MGMLQFGGPTLGWDEMLNREVEEMQDEECDEEDE